MLHPLLCCEKSDISDKRSLETELRTHRETMFGGTAARPDCSGRASPQSRSSCRDVVDAIFGLVTAEDVANLRPGQAFGVERRWLRISSATGSPSALPKM